MQQPPGVSLDARHFALPTRGIDRWEKPAEPARASAGKGGPRTSPAAARCFCLRLFFRFGVVCVRAAVPPSDECASSSVAAAAAQRCAAQRFALPMAALGLRRHRPAGRLARQVVVLHVVRVFTFRYTLGAHRHRLAAADTDSARAMQAAHTLECALDCRDGGLHRHGLIGLIRKIRHKGRLVGNADRMRRRLYVAVRVSDELTCVPTVPNGMRSSVGRVVPCAAKQRFPARDRPTHNNAS